MPDPTLLLSILTCVMNAREDFQITAQSLPIALPTWAEWVVVDGASTDGTLNLARADTRCDTLVSEPDLGVYDAYNKALRHARGRYVWYLNAGDRLADDIFPALEALCAAHPDDAHPPIYCLSVYMERWHKAWHANPAVLTKSMSIPTPGVLIPRVALQNCGGFNTAMRTSADYDILLRLQASGRNRFVVDARTLTSYKGGGLSHIHRYLGFLEETLAQIHGGAFSSDQAMFRLVRRMVLSMDLKDVPFARWRLALRLARKILY
jgi:putative colanic acid biosynthesis glycosyltransferase